MISIDSWIDISRRNVSEGNRDSQEMPIGGGGGTLEAEENF